MHLYFMKDLGHSRISIDRSSGTFKEFRELIRVSEGKDYIVRYWG